MIVRQKLIKFECPHKWVFNKIISKIGDFNLYRCYFCGGQLCKFKDDKIPVPIKSNNYFRVHYINKSR